MDTPFYGSSWNLPSRPRKGTGVREIPVHYVRSEQPVDRSPSAVKIQKVFRGFLVRKSVKKIAEIRSQVEEIDRRISMKETVDLIRRDAKERLRVNEMLMNLLFRLDSIRGVDSGVRECRKAVIKKTISLQEVMDAVVSNNDDAVDNIEKIVEVVDQTVTECAEDGEDRDSTVQDIAELVDDKEIVNNQNKDEDLEVAGNYDVIPSVSDCPEESVGTSETECQPNSSLDPQSWIEACEENDNLSSKQENDAIGTHQAEDREAIEKESRGPGKVEDNTMNRELLERMIEDNEKMMDMMSRLFERNEMQTRLLSSLSHRVEQLEKAFVCERLRRKKKRHAGTVDSCGTTPDNKKCGKR